MKIRPNSVCVSEKGWRRAAEARVIIEADEGAHLQKADGEQELQARTAEMARPGPQMIADIETMAPLEIARAWQQHEEDDGRDEFLQRRCRSWRRARM